MVDRKHSLHILGNLITAGNITSIIVYLHGVRVRERGREREKERERERERERDKESGREGGRERHRKNTSQVLATAQLQVYAQGFQLVLSPAWRATVAYPGGVLEHPP